MQLTGLVVRAWRWWRAQWLLGMSRGMALGIVLLLTAAIHGIAIVNRGIADAALLLLVVPIAVIAMSFGLKGGLAAALVGFAMTIVWLALGDIAEPPITLLVQVVAFFVVGALIGRTADQRRALEGALARHHDLSPDLVCTANYDGFLTRVNPAWTRTLGYGADELLAKPFLDFVHPDDREATLVEARRQTEAGEEVLNFENRYRHRDGSYRWLEWTSGPDSHTKQLMAVARDVTARKEAEDMVRRYQQILEQAVDERTQELRQRTDDLEEARLEILQRLALAAEYRDDDTYEHTERVAHTSFLLAEQLGLPESEIALIGQAAPLHDIGKLAVPDAILLKPAKLTPGEFEEMRGHAAAGAAILSDSTSDILQLAEQIALTHHEWWDGSGYPAGLKGEAIPLGGRIVALADVYDALTHARPYKKAWPIEKAVSEIHRLRDRQFDPAVVGAFQQLDPAELAGHRARERSAPVRLASYRSDPIVGRQAGSRLVPAPGELRSA